MLILIFYLKIFIVKIFYSDIALVKILLIKIFLIKKFLISLIIETFLVLYKQIDKQFKKYQKQINIINLLDICFLIDKFNFLINKNANSKSI